MGDHLIKAGFNAAEELGSRLNNVISRHADQSKDNEFQRLALENGSASYNKNDYQRIGFSSKKEATAFVNEMSSQGINVNLSAVKLDGQYQAEILKNNTIYEDGVAKIVTSEELISDYTNAGYGNVYDAKNYMNDVHSYSSAHSYDNSAQEEAGALGSYLENNLDYLGKAISEIQQIASLADAYGVNSNMQAFEGTGEIKTGKANTATVINGDTVIIDGKVVTDAKTRDYVLDQYNARMERADEILNDNRSTDKKGLEMRQNAQNMRDNMYNQEFAAPTVKSQANLKGGSLDNITNAFNTGGIVLNSGSASLSAEEIALINKAADMTGSIDENLARVRKGVTELTFQEREAVVNLLQSIKDKKGILSESEQKLYDGMVGDNGRLLLNKAEREGLEKYYKVSEAVKKDLGLNFSRGKVSRDDVLKINQAFFDKARANGLNVAFINKRGGFNVSALEMANVKNVFSQETLDLMKKLNAKGAWGTTSFGAFSRIGKLSGRITKAVGDEDLAKMVQGGTKVAKYSQQAATTVHQYSQSIRSAVAIRKQNKAGVKKTDGLSAKKAKQPKPKKELDPEKALKREEKYIKKTEKKLKKLNRSEKNPFAKFRQMRENVMARLSRTKVVKALNKINAKLTALLIKIILIALVVVLVLAGIIVIAVVIFLIIEAIANFIGNLTQYLPSWFNKSSAYHLVKQLKKEEYQWVEAVEEMDNKFKDRDEMTYGIDAQEFADYILGFEGQLEDYNGNSIYVNPFYKVVGLATRREGEENNVDALTSLNGYNGEMTVGYSSNVNAYGYRGVGENGSYSSTESGHTSNVKDIVSMTDIMFEYEQNSATDDGEFRDILGETPAALDWKNFWNGVGGFFKMIGHNIATFFSNLFGGGDKDEGEYITFEDATKGTVSYKTLQNYAEHLFHGSHRNQVDLSVSYYPVQKLMLNINGEMVEWENATVNDAAALGICNDPVTKNYKIFHNYTDPKASYASPYLSIMEEDEYGNKHEVKYDLSTYDFETINIFLENFKPREGETLCLQSWFASNATTWSFIVPETNPNGSVKTTHPCWTSSSSQTPHRISGSGSGSTRASAESAARARWETARDNALATFGSLQNTYLLSTDWDKFTSTRYVGNFSASPSYSTYSYTVPRYDGKGNKVGESTYYSSTASSIAYYSYVETFTRNCKSHPFEYCGGHINVNSQGITYSMTNEQLAMMAAYNSDDEVPVIKDYDFKANGYNDLLGKHFPNDIDYSLPSEASKTGGAPLPIENVQGSDAAHRGLNLNISDSGGFNSGYSVREDIPSSLIRDIFDIDCLIDKGGNVFLWGSHYEDYEGWSSDNMSLAIGRTTIDWLSTYGTDANIELDRKTSSNEEITGISTADDLKNIINSLKAKYGSDFTEDREAAVTLALSWLGRGHYSEDHKDHAFLSEICVAAHDTTITYEDGTTTTIHYDANCTASDDEGFVKFILNRTDKLTNVQSDLSTIGTWSGYSSTSDLLPADIIRHKVSTGSDYTDLVLTGLPQDNGINYVRDVLKAYSDERYVFVIGVLGTDVKLQNQATLRAGTLLTVDLQVYDNIGTIRLHVDKANSWDNVGFVKYEDGENQNSFLRNYYWVTSPDASTKRIRLY